MEGEHGGRARRESTEGEHGGKARKKSTEGKIRYEKIYYGEIDYSGGAFSVCGNYRRLYRYCGENIRGHI